MPVKYIGRTHSFKGKTLWEILGNLKNHGVGRLVMRNVFQRYTEPSFLKILKVAACSEPEPKPGIERKVIVLVERTFRGKIDPIPVQMDRVTYKTDFILIPKDQEAEYLKRRDLCKFNASKILPRTMELPPVLKEILVRRCKQKGMPTPDLKLPLSYSPFSLTTKYRVAEENETPTVKFDMERVGVPVNPALYKHVKPIS